MQAEEAFKRFELENEIAQSVDSDELFAQNKEKNDALRAAKPWAADVHYFKKVKISALALLKMTMHAKSGCPLEVMGILQGRLEDNTFIVLDCFALPVEGSETRVTAMEESYEYMIAYTSSCDKAGRSEPVVGWYHSHPSYGCWLSGIDVSTQMTQQQHQDPFLAIVVDPVRTCSAGKVEIGAFRTYPASYKADESTSEYQTIPLDKIEDFGVHCKQYYSLEVSFFKSNLDRQLISLLWNKYWISTLSSSPLLTNREYATKAIRDLAEKIEIADSGLTSQSFKMGGGGAGGGGAAGGGQEKKSELRHITKDGCKIACEQIHALMSQIIKDRLFNSPIDTK